MRLVIVTARFVPAGGAFRLMDGSLVCAGEYQIGIHQTERYSVDCQKQAPDLLKAENGHQCRPRIARKTG
jgi:hypothetical protein